MDSLFLQHIVGTVMAAGPANIMNTETDFGNWIVIEHEIDGKNNAPYMDTWQMTAYT